MQAVWPLVPRWFGIAVALNYPWEMAQPFLYAGMPPLNIRWWHCFVASLGDGVLVLAIFAVVWMAARRHDWSVRLGAGGYVVMFATGFVVAVGVELLALREGRWIYAPTMPLLPWPRVGIVPVVQMLVLPPVIFRMAAPWRRDDIKTAVDVEASSDSTSRIA